MSTVMSSTQASPPTVCSSCSSKRRLHGHWSSKVNPLLVLNIVWIFCSFPPLVRNVELSFTISCVLNHWLSFVPISSLWLRLYVLPFAMSLWGALHEPCTQTKRQKTLALPLQDLFCFVYPQVGFWFLPSTLRPLVTRMSITSTQSQYSTIKLAFKSMFKTIHLKKIYWGLFTYNLWF